jgi:hypothetical protein
MHNYCQKCGLQYRIWSHKIENPICDECEPEKFEEQHKKSIVFHKKRNVGQSHITEHTFFPKFIGKPYTCNWKNKRKWDRRQQK